MYDWVIFKIDLSSTFQSGPKNALFFAEFEIIHTQKLLGLAYFQYENILYFFLQLIEIRKVKYFSNRITDILDKMIRLGQILTNAYKKAYWHP